MAWELLAAETVPTDVSGWLIGAIVALCGAISAMAIWYAKAREPAFAAQLSAIVKDSADMLKTERDDFNHRIDAREQAHDQETAQLRSDCRAERTEFQKLIASDNLALRATLAALTEAVHQLRVRCDKSEPKL